MKSTRNQPNQWEEGAWRVKPVISLAKSAALPL
jgi:hypothetical protein